MYRFSLLIQKRLGEKEKIMAMVYCRGCAKEIHESAASCPHCGAVQHTETTKNSSGVSVGVLVIGYLCTFFFPIVGIGIGIYTIAKQKIGHGIAMIGLSLFFIFVFIAVLSH